MQLILYEYYIFRVKKKHERQYTTGDKENFAERPQISFWEVYCKPFFSSKTTLI